MGTRRGGFSSEGRNIEFEPRSAEEAAEVYDAVTYKELGEKEVAELRRDLEALKMLESRDQLYRNILEAFLAITSLESVDYTLFIDGLERVFKKIKNLDDLKQYLRGKIEQRHLILKEENGGYVVYSKLE